MKKIVVETHPDSFVDLRLDCPFPALLDFVKSFDFQAMDSHEHSHIPAVVIIIHFMELFKSTVSLHHLTLLPGVVLFCFSIHEFNFFVISILEKHLRPQPNVTSSKN